MVKAETIILRQQMKKLSRVQRKGFRVIGNDLYMHEDDESTRYTYGRMYFNPETKRVKVVESES